MRKTVFEKETIHPWVFCLALIFGLMINAPFLRSAPSLPPKRPNILLITVDTLRADRVSCYDGSHLKTPHIDGLAEQGVQFTRAFANTSTTLPSHANIMLGVSPLYHGVHENQHFVIREQFLTLAEHLKASGYTTGAFVGAFPLDRKFGLAQGFDVYDDNFGHRSSGAKMDLERRAEEVTAPAFSWAKAQASPWFLWVHVYDPHDPYSPPAPYAETYASSPYDGEVAYVDAVMGNFLEELTTAGLLENTVLVFTGDHGESLGQHGEKTHGFFAYNTTVWIPFIMAGPGIAARKVDKAVCHLDIFPTVCDLLGLKSPEHLQGRSLMAAMRGRKLPERDFYFESLSPHYSMGWAPLQGIVSNNVKFIRSPIPELYDLEKDFMEQKNLAEVRELGAFRKKLDDIIARDTSSEAEQSGRTLDRSSLEKLRALGYVGGAAAAGAGKDESPRNDIKTLLPFYNRANEAWALHQAGKTEEGIDMLKEIISSRNDFDIAYVHLATLYLEGQGKTTEALEVLKQGFSVNPNSYEIFYKYVNFLIRAGRNDKAIELTSAARLRQMDYDPDIWTTLGAAYQNTGDFETARLAYEKALRIDPRYPKAYHNLGFMQFTLALNNKDVHAYQASLEYYKRAIEIDPEYAAAYSGLGDAYLHTGNLEGGIYCLEKSLELQPDQGPVIYNLGLAYFNKGDKKKALELFNRFKNNYTGRLSTAQRSELDDLIKKCGSPS